MSSNEQGLPGRPVAIQAIPLSDEDDLLDALDPVVMAFRQLNIPHFVGASIAGLLLGATRSTNDVDLNCELTDLLVHPIG